MTRQTWTALVSAALFVVLAALIALTPVPYVGWAPGNTYNLLGSTGGKPAISITGVPSYPGTGQVRMVTVSVTRADSHLTLPEAMIDYIAPNHHVMPRDWVYPVGTTTAQSDQQGNAQLTASQQSATVAALRAANVAVQQNPVVVSVSVGGPAYNELKVGDVIETVDNAAVATRSDVVSLLRKHKVGDTVVIGVDRGGDKLQFKLVTAPSSDDRTVPQIGITSTDGFRYAPVKVEFSLDPAVQGPSGGLMLALGVYDLLTPNGLVRDRIVAGTGQIDANGAVSAISGAQEKLRAAELANSQIFLLPAANCVDVSSTKTKMSVVKVSTLDDAIKSLSALQADPAAAVPRC